MKQEIAAKILDLHETMRYDACYKELILEHDALNDRFLRQLKSMTQEQQDAVTDYCGLLIELHLKILELTLDVQ